MAAEHREMAKERQVAISHISEQAQHNKDAPDAEFAVAKSSYILHLKRRDSNASDYIEVGGFDIL